MSLSLYTVYNSSLYFLLHSPLSFVGPKMALKTFLSKTPSLASLDFDLVMRKTPKKAARRESCQVQHHATTYGRKEV